MTSEKTPVETQPRVPTVRWTVTGFIIVLVAAYTGGVVGGFLPEEQQINAVHLGLILLGGVVCVLLINPEALSRVKQLELSGFKLEMLERVEKVKERQTELDGLVEDIQLMMPVLLPEREQKHLLNLALGRTDDYHGGGSLRAELRRLRSIKLIRMRDKHTVAEMESGKNFDLADYVRLTERGEHWVRRIQQIEGADGEAE